MDYMLVFLAIAVTFSTTVYFIVNKAEKKLSIKDEIITIKEKNLSTKDSQIDNLKNKKREYTVEEKQEYAQKQKLYKIKGAKFEKQIANYYKDLGYLVQERGKEKGLKDKGIDLVIKKDDIYTLIQCKNYAPTSKVTEKPLRTFYGDCNLFIENNSKLTKENTELLFIVSNEKSISRTAKQYLKDYRNFKCTVIEYIEN